VEKGSVREGDPTKTTGQKNGNRSNLHGRSKKGGLLSDLGVGNREGGFTFRTDRAPRPLKEGKGHRKGRVTRIIVYHEKGPKPKLGYKKKNKN